jgi:SAM-dependent methyltransferase
MQNLEASLAAYYDQEAGIRERRPMEPERESRLRDYINLLNEGGRRRVLEIGVGPGREASLLQQHGLSVTGVDLSPEHVKRCRQRGIQARRASVHSLPYEGHAFDAGWTMSTLLHVPNSSFDTALREIRRVLVPGAPLAIGLWGGHDREALNESDAIEPKRFFSSRSNETLRRMLAPHGTIERFDTWPDAKGTDHIYQWCLLRVDA